MMAIQKIFRTYGKEYLEQYGEKMPGIHKKVIRDMCECRRGHFGTILYECDECDCRWQDEWSCMCDDECPNCGARDMSPIESDDLTEIIEKRGEYIIFLLSSDQAEHDADYREIARLHVPQM